MTHTTHKTVTIVTIVFFTLTVTLFSGSYSMLFSYPKNLQKSEEEMEHEITRLLKEADENYQNGRFKEAIIIYESVIQRLNEKKELVKTKQKLFQIMVSLALTHFTIRENDKARAQLEKLLALNPHQELDPEYYPPKFINLFEEAKKNVLASLEITSEPTEADIYINDKKVGKTPFKKEKFVAGDYRLKAQLKGYAAKEEQVTVKAARANQFHLQLEKEKVTPVEPVTPKEKVKKEAEEEKPRVIEKPAPTPKKKKKKISPVLIVAGAAVVVAAVLLLSGGKEKKVEPRIVFRDFINTDETIIRRLINSVSIIKVSGLPNVIEKLDYEVVIEHPSIQDLTVSLLGTDNRTTFFLWNRQSQAGNSHRLTGSSTTFNAINPNGQWKLVVTNHGNALGRIVQWSLRIHYKQ
ncbi:MAG: PEGA domain-containing protein [Candidatus Aminicenantes bacterium]|nr:PEGA domain-containing protein [Candidatus Aminicenantes bacterium]NIM79712.1 PEGA domain-containing protein [Candidatus Aminicenantes bacterium]NIN17761.1 PEGA domain-containing protein [Candidatus Aminicenantes bacterium]NIN41662.1 PEGA domain-containing protein [Candidatus Aminicenantes bacterium]NIN84411.1 PEGA domain-containing protein [Candidatus Aminicenantes bacterium]